MLKRKVPLLEIDTVIDCDFAQYKVIELLGKGGYGAVYKVEEIVTSKNYAVKTEIIKSDDKIFEALLPWEETILLELQKLSDAKKKQHFVKVVDRGVLHSMRLMMMTLIGKSLRDLMINQENYSFSQNCCWKIAHQTLEALDAFHTAGFVHRDIKPHNYAIGLNNESSVIFMLDFGLVRCYTGVKYPSARQDTTKFAGTVKYCSRSAFLNVYQYPKDDIESWIFTIMELHNPDAIYWKNLTDREKVSTLKGDLFVGKEPSDIFGRIIPIEYKVIINMIGKLTPIEKLKIPDDELKKKVNLLPFYETLEHIGKINKFKEEKPFIWEKTKTEKVTENKFFNFMKNKIEESVKTIQNKTTDAKDTIFKSKKLSNVLKKNNKIN